MKRWDMIVRSGYLALLLLGMGLSVSCGGGGGGGGLNLNDIGDNDPNVVLAIGDSITYGRTFDGGAPYPQRLAGAIGKVVVNAGAPGEQTAQGLQRMAGLLRKHKPGVVIILFGANDAIQGVNAQVAANNIAAMVALARGNQSQVLVGTLTPIVGYRSIYDPRARTINSLFPPLVREQGARVVDLRREFAGREAELILDGLHPTSAGNDVIAVSFAEQF